MQIRAADLELFFAIHDCGSLTHAGSRLGLNQSTISRRLTELEARLGAALFIRAREGVHVTQLGARWIEPAEATWMTSRAAERACLEHLGDVQVAEVTVTATHSIADHVITPALPSLIALHPRLRIRVLATGQILDMARLEADIAIRPMRPKVGDLVVQRLAQVDIAVAASEALAIQLAGHPPQTWPWLSLGDDRVLPPPIAKWQAANGVQPRLTFGSGSSHIVALRAGLGVGWLADRLRAHVGLTAMPMTGLPRFEGSLWMTAHQAYRKLPHVDVVWRWLEGIFKFMPVAT
ncbi:MAG: DNA-binding transcriptional LysR family regulator [Bradymonadia bacterium]|jgi:DNA-binding transcriptional LysR family regulator